MTRTRIIMAQRKRRRTGEGRKKREGKKKETGPFAIPSFILPYPNIPMEKGVGQEGSDCKGKDMEIDGKERGRNKGQRERDIQELRRKKDQIRSYIFQSAHVSPCKSEET
jgi:hypothetical protein